MLRLLLLLEKNDFKYRFDKIHHLKLKRLLKDCIIRDIVLGMEDHDEKRRNSDPETWNLQKLFIVDFIQKVIETLNLTLALGI